MQKNRLNVYSEMRFQASACLGVLPRLSTKVTSQGSCLLLVNSIGVLSMSMVTSDIWSENSQNYSLIHVSFVARSADSQNRAGRAPGRF